MLKNKLYESVSKYFDKYLYGFDASQLDMSILKGKAAHFYLCREHKPVECEPAAGQDKSADAKLSHTFFT
jgi:hypothetical protein